MSCISSWILWCKFNKDWCWVLSLYIFLVQILLQPADIGYMKHNCVTISLTCHLLIFRLAFTQWDYFYNVIISVFAFQSHFCKTLQWCLTWLWKSIPFPSFSPNLHSFLPSFLYWGLNPEPFAFWPCYLYLAVSPAPHMSVFVKSLQLKELL